MDAAHTSSDAPFVDRQHQPADGDLETPGRDGVWMAAATLCQVYSREDGSGPVEHGFEPIQAPALPQFPNTSMSGSTATPLTPLDQYPSPNPCHPLHDLEHLGLDGSAAFNILHGLLLQATRHGPSSILGDLRLDPSLAIQCLYGKVHPRYPPELTLALLAIALELYPSQLSGQVQENRVLLIDTLRIEFLKRIPVVTWKSTDVNCYQPLVLSLASFTWCMDEQLAAVAAQWNGVAQLLLNALPPPSDHETETFHNLSVLDVFQILFPLLMNMT
jgi:hypothetical protein